MFTKISTVSHKETRRKELIYGTAVILLVLSAEFIADFITKIF